MISNNNNSSNRWLTHCIWNHILIICCFYMLLHVFLSMHFLRLFKTGSDVWAGQLFFWKSRPLCCLSADMEKEAVVKHLSLFGMCQWKGRSKCYLSARVGKEERMLRAVLDYKPFRTDLVGIELGAEKNTLQLFIEFTRPQKNLGLFII